MKIFCTDFFALHLNIAFAVAPNKRQEVCGTKYVKSKRKNNLRRNMNKKHFRMLFMRCNLLKNCLLCQAQESFYLPEIITFVWVQKPGVCLSLLNFSCYTPKTKIMFNTFTAFYYATISHSLIRSCHFHQHRTDRCFFRTKRWGNTVMWL